MMRHGIAAEFADEPALLAAIRRARARGLSQLEVYSPVPSEQIDAALGKPRSRLAVACGLGALAGALGAYALQWYLVAYLYPIDLGGRPPHMPLAYLIITIEMGFLVGALAVFVGFLIAARLVRLWDPISDVPGIESATRDKFWLAIDGDDPAISQLGDALHDAGCVATFGGAA
ncbi:MAG: DUF3341 domain-containing protein [Deltaproteobacteria bacterium]|nr:DUF3341 domain-containing protein [Deltaproteobacteria bacterium]